MLKNIYYIYEMYMMLGLGNPSHTCIYILKYIYETRFRWGLYKSAWEFIYKTHVSIVFTDEKQVSNEYLSIHSDEKLSDGVQMMHSIGRELPYFQTYARKDLKFEKVYGFEIERQWFWLREKPLIWSYRYFFTEDGVWMRRKFCKN
jgi:hypothetical protein